MNGMRVDHVVYAAERDGLKATAQRLAEQIGVTPVDGGIHPRFGTRNIILPLAHERYVEVVEVLNRFFAVVVDEVLDHPASDKAPFGQAVRARSEAGGGWLGWVVQVDDITEQESRLGREAVDGNRHRPDGVELRWRQLGIKGLQSDPQLPYFIEWAQGVPHPSGDAATEVTIESDRRRARPGARVARPARRLDVDGHRLHVRLPARHARPHGRHVRHPERRRHHLTRSRGLSQPSRDQRRSRRLLLTTSTLEAAMAPPAIIGLSSPAIASGIAAML